MFERGENVEDKMSCDFMHIHNDIVEKVKENMIEEEKLYDLAELYKAFGDSTRIRILYVLSEAEMCVCDISKLLNMTVSAVSHQLKVLKNTRLVKSRKDGKSVFYSLDDAHVFKIISNGIEHINH